MMFHDSTPSLRLVGEPVTSRSNPAYHRLDLDILYYTCSIISLRWSLDGEQVYFDTNITGRYNIWRVPSTGG